MKNLITRNPKILGGKPIIAGTRMSVESLLELFASGMETKEILKEYPFLKKEHIEAALRYAAEVSGRKTKFIQEEKSSNLPATPHEISRRR